jgi:probable HAF family extracellular repeat protein
MKTLTSLIGLLTISSIATAQTVTFEQIPGTTGALDMSSNGRFVVGGLNGGGTYLWDRQLDIMTTLPAAGLDAVGVSENGKFIVGDILNPEGDGSEVAGRWSQTTNMWEGLGYLPNALQCPSRSNSYEVSANGSKVVGLSWDGCSGRAFQWTNGTGMVELESLANGSNRASVVSADGSVIGGFAQGTFSRTPAIWDGTTTLGTLVGPDGPNAQGEVRGMSDDGSTLLGTVWLGVGVYYEAVTWTMGETGWEANRIGNGSIIEGWAGNAMDIADDGTIVGFDSLLGNRRAWIQPGGTGPIVLLQQYIEEHGGTVPEGVDLAVCRTISSDGSTIIGFSTFAGGWIVTIDPGPCAADITGPTPGEADGNVDALDFLLLIAQWGTPCVGSCEADITGPTPNTPDGNVDSLDFLLLIAQWGTPGNCPQP